MRARNEGSVYKLPNGRWRAQINLGDGKYLRRNAATQNEAKDILRQLTNDREEGIVIAGDLTVTDLINEWEATGLKNREYTDGGIVTRSHLTAWKESSIGTRRIAQLVPADVSKAMAKMRKPDGSPYSRQTMTKRRCILGQVFDSAIKSRGMKMGNPVRLADLPADGTKLGPRRSFTAEQTATIIAKTTRHAYGPVYLIGLTLGLRPGEIFGLQRDAIDFRRGTLHVRRGVRMVKGKATIVDDLKTSGALRTIALPPVVSDALRAHLEQQGPAPKDALVFPNLEGKPMDLRNFAQRYFTPTITALGFGDDWTPNEMRHTCASLLVDAGVHLRAIADLLGHSTTKMLELYYRAALKPETDAHVLTMQTLFGAPKRRRNVA
jgi:integrase